MVDITRPVYGTVWANTGEKLSPIEAKLESGWVQEMMPYQYENFLQNRQDVAITYFMQKGVPEWSNTQEYIANKSIVTYAGNLYVSLLDNTGITPTTTDTWRRLTVTFAPNGTIPIAMGGTGATSASDARTNLGLGTASTLSADSIVLKAPSGGAAFADKWTSPISLTLSGGAAGTTSFDGSSNATLNVTSLNATTLTGTVPATSLTNAVTKTSPTGSAVLPAGTVAQRDLTPSEGWLRWNTSNKITEVFNGTDWVVSTSQNTAFVLDRANHTGEQAISTVTGLQTALNLKANLASPLFTGLVIANSSPPSVSISALTGSNPGYESRAQGIGGTAGAATIGFHRPNAHVVHFGLDTDNKLKVGGGSLGTNAYAIYHEKNKPTKADVGLGNVDNTTDTAKPVSTAQQAALDTKVEKTSATGAALLPGGNDAQRPTNGSIPSNSLAVRGNTQDPVDYKPEFWDRVANAWRTFASRTWVKAITDPLEARPRALGDGQTWQTVTRSPGVTYTNTTGRSIVLQANVSGTSAAIGVYVSLNGAPNIQFAGMSSGTGPASASGSIVIPVGATYLITFFQVTSSGFSELR